MGCTTTAELSRRRGKVFPVDGHSTRLYVPLLLAQAGELRRDDATLGELRVQLVYHVVVERDEPREPHM